jgi:hypothetical protein
MKNFLEKRPRTYALIGGLRKHNFPGVAQVTCCALRHGTLASDLRKTVFDVFASCLDGEAGRRERR